MKTRASCRYLTHPYAAFLGCTLDEVLVMTGVYLLGDLLLSLLFALCGGSFFLCFLIAFSVSLIAIRGTCRLVGLMKENKQPGYLSLRCKQWLHHTFGYQSALVTRQGYWLTRRSIG